MYGGLIEACRNAHTVKGLVEVLESGVDPNVKDEQGNTGLMVAVMHGSNFMVVDTLLQFGADVNAVNNNKQNALNIAFEEIAVTKGNHLDKIIARGEGRIAMDVAVNSPFCLWKPEIALKLMERLYFFGCGFSNSFLTTLSRTFDTNLRAKELLFDIDQNNPWVKTIFEIAIHGKISRRTKQLVLFFNKTK